VNVCATREIHQYLTNCDFSTVGGTSPCKQPPEGVSAVVSHTAALLLIRAHDDVVVPRVHLRSGERSGAERGASGAGSVAVASSAHRPRAVRRASSTAAGVAGVSEPCGIHHNVLTPSPTCIPGRARVSFVVLVIAESIAAYL
jgi:hypothetical protein